MRSPGSSFVCLFRLFAPSAYVHSSCRLSRVSWGGQRVLRATSYLKPVKHGLVGFYKEGYMPCHWKLVDFLTMHGCWIAKDVLVARKQEVVQEWDALGKQKAIDESQTNKCLGESTMAKLHTDGVNHKHADRKGHECFVSLRVTINRVVDHEVTLLPAFGLRKIFALHKDHTHTTKIRQSLRDMKENAQRPYSKIALTFK